MAESNPRHVPLDVNNLVETEHACSVCFGAMVQALHLPCRHTICQECTARWKRYVIVDFFLITIRTSVFCCCYIFRPFHSEDSVTVSGLIVPSAGVECHPSTDSGDTGPVHEKKMCRMSHCKWRFYALLTVLKCTD